MAKITYKTCLSSSEAKNERNDCAVKAVAIATGVGYEKAHSVFAKLGRRNGRGVSWEQMVKAIKQCTGHDINYDQIFKPNGQRYTGRTIGQALPSGKYILIFKGHVAALVDGVIEDWTEARCKRILGYWKIK